MPVDGPLYPVNLRLGGRRCLVVGGGRVAAQKVAGLLDADAIVHVVANDVGDDVRALVANGAPLTWEQRPYANADLTGGDESSAYWLVITATDDPAANRQVFLDGEAAHIWVNSADDPANCSFTLPARIRQGSLLVTFATGGHSPAIATWLRRRFTEEFGPEYATLIDMLAVAREEIRAEGRSTEGLDWQGALDSGMLEMIREGNLAEAKERLQACLSLSSE